MYFYKFSIRVCSFNFQQADNDVTCNTCNTYGVGLALNNNNIIYLYSAVSYNKLHIKVLQELRWQ